jgi:antitoxin MazE
MLTKIGNSKGVIIPAQLLKQCQFDGMVMLEVRDKSIFISRPDQPRSGWEETFKAARSEDELLIDETVINDYA